MHPRRRARRWPHRRATRGPRWKKFPPARGHGPRVGQLRERLFPPIARLSRGPRQIARRADRVACSTPTIEAFPARGGFSAPPPRTPQPRAPTRSTERREMLAEWIAVAPRRAPIGQRVTRGSANALSPTRERDREPSRGHATPARLGERSQACASARAAPRDVRSATPGLARADARRW